MTPDGWERDRLAELLVYLGRGTSPTYATTSSVFAVNQKCVRDGRVTVDFVRPHEAGVNIKPESVLRAGDVCVNSTGTGTIGRVGLWATRGAGTYFADTHVTIARPDPSRVVSKFLAESLLFPALQREMEVSCFTGSTNQVELSKSALGELTLLLPPLGEQKKIAAILSSVDEAIEATQAVIDQLQVVKKAMMAELLTRGLPGRHTRFKQTEIGEVPEEWDVTHLHELAVVAYGLTVNAQRRASNATRPYLTVANVQDEGFDLANVKDIGVLAGDERYELRTGDVLLVEGNANTERVGRAFIWKGEVRGALHQNHLIRVRMMPGERALPPWLAIALNGVSGRRQILDHAKTSSGLHTINSKAVAGLRVPLPTVEEQRGIVAIRALLQRRIETERLFSEALEMAKKALMSVLLTGEVRVKPDEVAP